MTYSYVGTMRTMPGQRAAVVEILLRSTGLAGRRRVPVVRRLPRGRRRGPDRRVRGLGVGRPPRRLAAAAGHARRDRRGDADARRRVHQRRGRGRRRAGGVRRAAGPRSATRRASHPSVPRQLARRRDPGVARPGQEVGDHRQLLRRVPVEQLLHRRVHPRVQRVDLRARAPSRRGRRWRGGPRRSARARSSRPSPAGRARRSWSRGAGRRGGRAPRRRAGRAGR